MKISNAVRNAWKAYTASFSGMLVFLLAEICLVMICLAPMLFLTRSGLAWGACLTPLLWVFLLLPARMNAAMAMRGALTGGKLSTYGLVDMENYGAKLLCGLKRVFFLLLWSMPLIVLVIVGRIHFSGSTDSFTVLRMIRNEIGGGDQMTGLLRLALILAATLVLLMLGCAFHSGARHAFARQKMDIVKGHHGKIFVSWLISLVCILPALVAVAVAVLRYVPVLTNLNGLLMRTVTLPSTKVTVMILIAGILLTLPLLPLRSLIPAAYVNGLGEEE